MLAQVPEGAAAAASGASRKDPQSEPAGGSDKENNRAMPEQTAHPAVGTQ
jgi:hypothetical protein